MEEQGCSDYLLLRDYPWNPWLSHKCTKSSMFSSHGVVQLCPVIFPLSLTCPLPFHQPLCIVNIRILFETSFFLSPVNAPRFFLVHFGLNLELSHSQRLLDLYWEVIVLMSTIAIACLVWVVNKILLIQVDDLYELPEIWWCQTLYHKMPSIRKLVDRLENCHLYWIPVDFNIAYRLWIDSTSFNEVEIFPLTAYSMYTVLYGFNGRMIWLAGSPTFPNWV